MATETIYGTDIIVPDRQPGQYIELWDTPFAKDQYWRKKPLPAFFDEVKYDKEGDAEYTDEQWEYASVEIERCKKGFYFMNNGVETYLTGKNYFYLWELFY